MSAQAWDPVQRDVLAELGLVVYRQARTEDALLLALLRAAGRDRDAVDAVRVCAAWPAPQALRGNAAAKRALWPQVRALRASAGPG